MGTPAPNVPPETSKRRFEPSTFEPGSRIGPYEVVDLLGAGGMGAGVPGQRSAREPEPVIQFVEAASNRARLDAAREFVRSFPPGTEILVVGPAREAVDDFVRRELEAPSFGVHRFGLVQLAAHLAAAEMATAALAPATGLGLEAVAARVTFAAKRRGKIPRFQAVSSLPGFPRALASTLQELRAAAVAPNATDLGALLAEAETALAQAHIVDRAGLLRLALAGLGAPPHAALRPMPVLCLDLALESPLEVELLGALCRGAPQALATLPGGDAATVLAFESFGATRLRASASPSTSSLAHLRRYLFSGDAPPAATPDESVSFFSAPGEGRECLEIAREIVRAAEADMPFDSMAVFLRAPESYATFLDTAFRRANIPAYFARGTLRPDPAGRAFLALLACASEGLSARRFAEYLSFAQVPPLDPGGAPPAARPVWPAPRAEEFGLALEPAALASRAPAPGEQLTFWDLSAFTSTTEAHAHARLRSPRGARRRPIEAATPPATPALRAATAGDAVGAIDAAAIAPVALPAGAVPPDEQPAPEGSLRTPRKWEELLVEAAVIGGLGRWQRRLAGLARELQLKLESIAAVDPESPSLVALRRDLLHLGHLERFALPVIEALAGLPQSASWGTWVAELAALAPRVLRRPERALAVLGELLPMAEVGPVGLEEVRTVLAERLSTLEVDPPEYREGRVFVGRPEQARGRSFRLVFVPGLAERVFPQRPREDPLLLDDERRRLAPALRTQEQRGHAERLLLALALGAAEERAILSYSRLDAAAGRPQVPSFYALDAARAVRGTIPDFRKLEREAAARVRARLAWPAPPDPHLALDALEHDLAVLGVYMHGAPRREDKGRARYLLELNPHLARSLRCRYLRWQQPWRPEDGLVRSTAGTEAALAAHRPSARPYSATALQRFAACPYQFLLGAIHRLEPRRQSAALVQLDPLTRGRIFHHVQAETLRTLRAAGRLPSGDEALEEARFVLDATLEKLAAAYRDELAPAIERIWEDEIAMMRGDLRLWLQALSEQSRTWQPLHFEFTFGLDLRAAAGSSPHLAPAPDPSSISEAATLPGGWLLRGAVDMVEERRSDRALRVTDHKTGVDRTYDGLLVGGGEVLQPVLYALAVQALQRRQVVEGRLFFCTSRGRFRERIVPLGPFALEYAEQILKTVDEAVAQGMLPPLPRDGACATCDFRVVCGPHEEIRSRRKVPFPRLEQLREFP